MNPPKLVDPKVLRDLAIPPPRDKNFFEEQKWNIAIIAVMFLGFIFLLGRFKEYIIQTYKTYQILLRIMNTIKK